MTTDADCAIGLDVGGTNIRGGVVRPDGVIVDADRVPTPADAPSRLEAMVAMVRRLGARNAIGAVPVGVGAAGLVDLDGVVRYSPNLDWRDAPVRARLASALGVPVRVENDAAAAAWGEYRTGGGRHATGGALMLTIGTGVGGGLVVDDRLVRGASGIGGEFGHIIVTEGGPRCPCGNHGCLEAVASGSAIGRLGRDAVAGWGARDSLLSGAETVTGAVVTDAARQGDPLARQVLAEAGTWLGVGIASLVNALDPEIVIIGGGALDAGDLLLDPAVEAYHARVIAGDHRDLPPVVRAELGDDAGLIGAALLACDAGR